jgi:hypothetical protein
MGSQQMALKGFDRDSAVTFEGQQCRRDAVYFAAEYLPLDHRLDIHVCAFAAFNRVASSEFL